MKNLEKQIINTTKTTGKVIDTICQSIGIDLKGALEYIKEPFLPKTIKNPFNYPKNITLNKK